MAPKGIKKADFLSGIKAPPNNAIAATGVKLGRCGKSLDNAAIAIAMETNINLGDIVLGFIVTF